MIQYHSHLRCQLPYKHLNTCTQAKVFLVYIVYALAIWIPVLVPLLPELSWALFFKKMNNVFPTSKLKSNFLSTVGLCSGLPIAINMPNHTIAMLHYMPFTLTGFRHILYIANRSRWKSFVGGQASSNSLESFCGLPTPLFLKKCAHVRKQLSPV